jgi:DNA repair exonuclease SbcCD ATPase subunit
MVLENDTARPLTGDMIRETQARIDQTVGMDYDTFINSAFLVQGRADEFATKTPSERKAVLSKILGLETYDRLQVRARERSSWTDNTAKIAEGTVDRLRHELELLVAPATELKEVEVTLFEANKDLAEQQAKTTVSNRAKRSRRSVWLCWPKKQSSSKPPKKPPSNRCWPLKSWWGRPRPSVRVLPNWPPPGAHSPAWKKRVGPSMS